MAARVQLRRDTAANWASVNPVLAQGEQGYETDTGRIKIGDGATAWNALIYRLFDPSSVAITGGAIGGVPLRPYVGVVASRGCLPSSNNTTNKQAMSRSKHVAMEDIASLQLVFANFYLNGTSEINAGASTQFTASIEYPVGTLTRVTFGGAMTGVAADGGLLVSDSTPVNIPRGVPFYVRVWSWNTNGIVFCGSYGLNNVAGSVPASGEWWDYGPTTADLTGSTANSNNKSTGNHYKPAAIIGYTRRPTFYLAGDSRCHGSSNDVAPNSFGGVGEIERSIVYRFATLNAGTPGDTLANAANGNYAKRIQLAAYCSHVICEYGINDLSSGTTTATMLANLATFAGKFAGKPFYTSTISPLSASTDSWATLANQTTSFTANGNRVAYNNAIRAGLAAPVTGHIEVADQVESARDSGLWKVTGSANGYTADGLHGTPAGYSLIEVSTAFQKLSAS